MSKRKREIGGLVKGFFFFFFPPREKRSCGDPKYKSDRERRKRPGEAVRSDINALTFTQ